MTVYMILFLLLVAVSTAAAITFSICTRIQRVKDRIFKDALQEVLSDELFTLRIDALTAQYDWEFLKAFGILITAVEDGEMGYVNIRLSDDRKDIPMIKIPISFPTLTASHFITGATVSVDQYKLLYIEEHGKEVGSPIPDNMFEFLKDLKPSDFKV